MSVGSAVCAEIGTDHFVSPRMSSGNRKTRREKAKERERGIGEIVHFSLQSPESARVSKRESEGMAEVIRYALGTHTCW